MTTVKYTINILNIPQTVTYFTGLVVANNRTLVSGTLYKYNITNLYDYSQPSGGSYQDVFANNTFFGADNLLYIDTSKAFPVYLKSSTGVNILDSGNSALQSLSPGSYETSIAGSDGLSTTGGMYFLNSSGSYLSIAITCYITFTLYVDPVVSCFNEGTKILTLNRQLEDEYVAIEKLYRGDLVKTHKHGYRKIQHIGKNHFINNPNCYYECMYLHPKDNEKKVLEDLIITGNHGILLDAISIDKENEQGFSFKIDDKHLLLAYLADGFQMINDNNQYTYYHLTLEDDGDDNLRFGIWANGVLTETTCRQHYLEKTWIEN